MEGAVLGESEVGWVREVCRPQVARRCWKELPLERRCVDLYPAYVKYL